jgi:hypothetical protein
MVNRLDQKEVVTLDELTLSNAWELKALVEVLEILMELRRRNPIAAAPYSDLAADPHKAGPMRED